jgi:hypothetical protein
VFTVSVRPALVFAAMQKMALEFLEVARHRLLSVVLAIVGGVFTALVQAGLLSREIAQVALVYGDQRIALGLQVENFTIMRAAI